MENTLEYIDIMYVKGAALEFDEREWGKVRLIVASACGFFTREDQKQVLKELRELN